MSTLKEILDSVCDDDILERSSSYATSQEPEYRRLVRHSSKAVKDILSLHNWGALKRRETVNIIDGTTLYDLPETYSHLINDTANTASGIRNVDLPASDQLVSLSDTSDIHTYIGRILGNQLEIINAPAGEFHYMYMSKAAVNNSGVGVIDGEAGHSDSFITDNDTWLLDDELLIRAIIWRWQKAEGNPEWQTSLQDFTNYLNTLKGRDVGARVINEDRGTKYKYIPFWAKEVN